MRALRILSIGLLLAGLLVPTAWAQDEDDEEQVDYAREGWYVSGSGIFVLETWDAGLDHIGAKDSQGFNLRAGNRISPWVGVEIELEWIDDFFPHDQQDFSIVDSAVNTRVYPLGGLLGRVQPYALAGLGIASTVVHHRDRSTELQQSNADWAFRVGGGVDLYYTEHFAISAEAVYVWPVGDVKNVDHVSMGLGLLYRF